MKLNLEKSFLRFIFSYESYFIQNDFQIDKSFELLSKNFSRDVNVLLIIRNPYDFLNSIYASYTVYVYY